MVGHVVDDVFRRGHQFVSVGRYLRAALVQAETELTLSQKRNPR